MNEEEKVSESDTGTEEEEKETVAQHCFHEFEILKNRRRCRKCRMELKNDMY